MVDPLDGDGVVGTPFVLDDEVCGAGSHAVSVSTSITNEITRVRRAMIARSVSVAWHAPGVEIAAFLRRYPPFSHLTDERLSRVARSVEIAHFAAGTVILHQDGAPAGALHVIRKGAVELLDDDEPLDLLGEGEVFGRFSLLAHDRPTVSARAAEDTLCYLLAEPIAIEILEIEAGHSLLSSSLRQRLRAVGELTRSEPGDPRYRPVVELIRRGVVTADPGMTIARAADRMATERVSCLLVPMRGSWGILTDRDLRTRVVAVGADPGLPAESVATFPVRTIDPHILAGDALTEMFAAGVHHLPVVEGGRLIGVVTDTDLMGIGRHTPFAIKSAIARARTPGAVAEAGRGVADLVVALVESSADPVDVGRVIALVTDALTHRLIELAVEELGDPPVAFAWLALGSAARHEQALTADQDHALAYEGNEDPEIEAYFGALSGHVTSGLAAAGIPRGSGDAMADHPSMRGPVDRWVERFAAQIARPLAEESVLSPIGFDYRRQAGALDAESALDAAVRDARGNLPFLRTMARRALVHAPPTGFLGDLVVERRGENTGRLEVTSRGITIVTDMARVWGLASATTAKDTLGRLEAAAVTGALDPTLAEELADAFRFLWDVRLRHHVEQLRAGVPPDDGVDPAALGTVARGGLKEAFRVIGRAQRQLASGFGVDLR